MADLSIILVTALGLIIFIVLLAKKSGFEANVFEGLGRPNPRAQFRCKPYFNGRLAGSPRTAIRKLENDQSEITVKVGAFSSQRYPLKIPNKHIKFKEYPDTEHKEGLLVVEEFQLDVKADDPIVEAYKLMLDENEAHIAVLENRLKTVRDQIKRNASPDMLLASIRSLTPTIEKMKDATREKKDELQSAIIELPAPTKQFGQQNQQQQEAKR